MASPDAKSPSAVPLTSRVAAGGETYRTKSIAPRLTEAEFAEVESAAVKAGQKVSEWLRYAALAPHYSEGIDRGMERPLDGNSGVAIAAR